MKFYAISENHLYHSAFKNGKRKSSRSVGVYVLKDKKAWVLKKANPEKKIINRIGIQASKKVGGAVARNRAKRVIREAYRKIDNEYGIKQGWLIVITPYPAAAELKMQDVFRDLRYCLSKLDMLVNWEYKKPDTASKEQADGTPCGKTEENGETHV